MLNIRRYDQSIEKLWNELVANGRNSTFLTNRNYMDYHSDRFADCSLVFYDKDKAVACLPANYDVRTNTVYSHQGLTYGGLITLPKVTAVQVLEAFDALADYYRNELGASSIIYKRTPYIYNRYASDEDLYALFRHEAKLVCRGLSTCICLKDRLGMSQLRKRKIHKADDNGIVVLETDDIEAYWDILQEALATGHGVSPVHSADELRLLKRRFPNNIKLYAAYKDQQMIAGTVIYDCGNTVHTQYLAASPEGKQCGALDKVIEHLITNVYQDRQYFDFGVSTEEGGKILNEGLIFQKEGFGGRGICYDSYKIDLKS